MSALKIRRALISVSDKSGLIPLAKALKKYGVEILSTGGTLKALTKAKVRAIPIDAYTGSPEILDGRVKTLHPKIHGGLLFRRDKKSHVNEAAKHKIQPIDLVIVNLYPFEEVTKNPSVDLDTAIENIDIGGPSMLRSAAKNADAVTVICDPSDYTAFMEELKSGNGSTSAEFRKKCALKVFERTSSYDRAISSFLAGKLSGADPDGLPVRLDGVYEKTRDLRYGENPHQRAALYQRTDKAPRFQFRQLHGKEISFNNLLDIEATVDILREFTEPAGCVVKHTNPCGVAEGKNVNDALARAIECDSMSAFGGILGLNQPCSAQAAKTAMEMLPFFEVFVAPSFAPGALKILKTKKNLRLIETGSLQHGGPYDLRFIKMGILLQDRDPSIAQNIKELKKKLHFVTKTKLPAKEIEDLIFAWKCVKVVKSNAIVLTQGRQTVGIGAGQMSRVDSVDIACRKAGYRTDGAILASDAFFPMPDSIEVASQHKIKAIIQPGGSLRDADVIAACDQYGIAMALAGERHFRH